MPMDNMYTDYRDGQFIPEITVTKRADNGHYTASGCGLSVTHTDQAEAINRLSDKIKDGLNSGTVYPNM